MLPGKNAENFLKDFVSAMDTCTTQRFTWHPDTRDHPLAPPLIGTFATSFTWLIFHVIVMSYKGSVKQLCSSLIVAWCLIPNRFHRTNVCCDSLKNPTPFLKYLGFRQHDYYQYSNLHHHEVNVVAYVRYHILYLSHTGHTRIHMYTVIFIFWSEPTFHRVRCVPSIQYRSFGHDWYP